LAEVRSMDGSTWVLMGAVAGGVIGVLGGVFGTWMSLRGARSPAERAVLWPWIVACWVGVALFCVLAFVLPSPYRYLIWIAYVPLLVLGILRCNAQLARLRGQG